MELEGKIWKEGKHWIVKSAYENIGYENHAEMTTKADLVIEISSQIKNKKLTQKVAATMLNISLPKLCSLLKGHFKGFSVDRLIRFLTILGRDIDIIVKEQKKEKNPLKLDR